MESYSSFTLENNSPAIWPSPGRLLKIKHIAKSIEGISFMKDDSMIIADKDAGQVKVLNSEGRVTRTLASNIRPYGVVASKSGMVLVTDCKSKKSPGVLVYGPTGELVRRWGQKLDWRPRGLALDNRGRVVVTDTQQFRHQVGIFSMDGKVISKFGTSGTGPREFNNPWYVTVDMFDRIIVSDRDNHCVKIFDEQGKPLGKIGKRGSAHGQFLYPRGICNDSRGNILVCDTGNRRISVFSPDGRFIQQLLTSADGVLHPHAMSWSKSGKLAIAHHSRNEFKKLRVYSMIDTENNGTFITTGSGKVDEIEEI